MNMCNSRRFRNGATMGISLLVLSVLSLGAGGVVADDRFIDLFSGGDLSGWVVEGISDYEDKGGKAPVWTISDGVVTCSGHGFGFLRYDTQLCDFVLRLEYRMTKKCNSGIGIRGVKFTGSAQTRPSFAAYEIQILDDAGQSPSEHGSSSLYRYVAPTENAAKAAGQWNAIEIRCSGPKIRIVLNGKTVQDVDQTQIEAINDKPLCGYVSLQNHGKPIEFRNVQLAVLSEKSVPSPTAK
jgi:hypothetical protein